MRGCTEPSLQTDQPPQGICADWPPVLLGYRKLARCLHYCLYRNGTVDKSNHMFHIGIDLTIESFEPFAR